MAKVSTTLKVTAPATLRYWLAVDEDDVVVVNGVGTVLVDEGEQNVLLWWMIGNEGDALTIVGKVGEREVVNVKESKIPSGATKGAGYRKFTP